MAFTAQDVKTLREKTGCGMMDCKKALTEADGEKLLKQICEEKSGISFYDDNNRLIQETVSKAHGELT